MLLRLSVRTLPAPGPGDRGVHTEQLRPSVSSPGPGAAAPLYVVIVFDEHRSGLWLFLYPL